MPPRHSIPLSTEALCAQCRNLDCDIPYAALQPLRIYLELLMQWNKVMNLVGTRHWRDALTNLVVDSFYLAEFLDGLSLPSHPRTWDLGAGAGLPGIPLRMVWPHGEYTLVEAREKRAIFLSTALAHLRLPQTTVFSGRAEAFFAAAPEPADCIVSRAFLPWPEVLALVEDHVRDKGLTIFLTLTPPPDGLPTGWKLADARPYKAGGAERWFWALRRQDAGVSDESGAAEARAD